VLAERESLRFVADAGIATVMARSAPDAAAAAREATELGFPVAVKLDVDGLAHKTDVGGVALGLADEAAVRAATARLVAAATEAGLEPRGVLVEPMAPDGTELILGLQRDPLFGPAVVVGLGGTLAETVDDIRIALAPVTHRQAAGLLDGLRGRRMLDGVRGRPGVDRAAVIEAVVALSRLGCEDERVLDVDVNPIIASPVGAVAVDALVVLRA
jgi:acetyl-CoA synthetase/acetyltransferase